MWGSGSDEVQRVWGSMMPDCIIWHRDATDLAGFLHDGNVSSA